MRLSAPKQIVFWIALILAIVAVVFTFVKQVTFLHDWSFVILLVGFVILALGTFVKGL